MIRNHLVFRDWETGSKDRRKCQPVQLASIIIDVRRLEVIPNSIFESTLRPIFDDKKAQQAGLDPLEDEALDLNGHTRESLADAPLPKLVWENYCDYLTN